VLTESLRASECAPLFGERARKCVHKCYYYCMDTVTSEVSTRELRSQLSDVIGRTMYAGERIGVTRNGKLAAVVVSVADLEALEAFEMAQDVAAYREAKASDDGTRVTLDELRADLAS
jgi:prevent-host-death family protein